MLCLRAVIASYSGSSNGYWLPSQAVANYVIPSTCNQQSIIQVCYPLSCFPYLQPYRCCMTVSWSRTFVQRTVFQDLLRMTCQVLTGKEPNL